MNTHWQVFNNILSLLAKIFSYCFTAVNSVDDMNDGVRSHTALYRLVYEGRGTPYTVRIVEDWFDNSYINYFKD